MTVHNQRLKATMNGATSPIWWPYTVMLGECSMKPFLSFLCQHASMVDCVCVWLYSTLGCEVLEKAATLLGSECPTRSLVPSPFSMSSILQSV